MRVKLVRRDPGRADLDMMLGLLALGLAAGLLLLRYLPGEWLPADVCLFHRITGLPCLTCGGTRAALALSGGDFPAAFRWNPLAAGAILALIPVGLWALAARALGLRRLHVELTARRERLALGLLLLALAAANWAYLIATGV